MLQIVAKSTQKTAINWSSTSSKTGAMCVLIVSDKQTCDGTPPGGSNDRITPTKAVAGRASPHAVCSCGAVNCKHAERFTEMPRLSLVPTFATINNNNNMNRFLAGFLQQLLPSAYCHLNMLHPTQTSHAQQKSYSRLR